MRVLFTSIGKSYLLSTPRGGHWQLPLASGVCLGLTASTAAPVGQVWRSAQRTAHADDEDPSTAATIGSVPPPSCCVSMISLTQSFATSARTLRSHATTGAQPRGRMSAGLGTYAPAAAGRADVPEYAFVRRLRRRTRAAVWAVPTAMRAREVATPLARPAWGRPVTSGCRSDPSLSRHIAPATK